ncbi:hypothetical protein EWF95_09690 [Halonotius roseus]|uniref:Uncharacterized protein n=1 Tax=Halonotius roseus TaxID=2511997 RepID=A0A544QPE1_9EURY|nr:hypothetical protein EWF95_09690 [Halonotius roseus]
MGLKGAAGRRTRTLTRAKLSSAHQKSEISGDDASTAGVSNANDEERSESREPSRRGLSR